MMLRAEFRVQRNRTLWVGGSFIICLELAFLGATPGGKNTARAHARRLARADFSLRGRAWHLERLTKSREQSRNDRPALPKAELHLRVNDEVR